jgi:hypothetical protein
MPTTLSFFMIFLPKGLRLKGLFLFHFSFTSRIHFAPLTQIKMRERKQRGDRQLGEVCRLRSASS